MLGSKRAPKMEVWWENPDGSSLASKGKQYTVPGGRVDFDGKTVFLNGPATIMSRVAGQVTLWAPGTQNGEPVDMTFCFPEKLFDAAPPEMLDWNRHAAEAVPVARRRPRRVPNADSGRKLPPARGFDGRFVKRRARCWGRRRGYASSAPTARGTTPGSRGTSGSSRWTAGY